MANIQLHPVARRKTHAASTAQERTKGETVEPTAVLQLIAKVGVTEAHRLTGLSTTTLHKARKPGAVVTKAYEIAAEHILREMQMHESRDATTEANHHVVVPRAAAPAEPLRRGATRLMIIEVPEEKADSLERIAKAWGAEFTKA